MRTAQRVERSRQAAAQPVGPRREAKAKLAVTSSTKDVQRAAHRHDRRVCASRSDAARAQRLLLAQSAEARYRRRRMARAAARATAGQLCWALWLQLEPLWRRRSLTVAVTQLARATTAPRPHDPGLRQRQAVRTTARQLHEDGRRDWQLAGGCQRAWRAPDAALFCSEEEAAFVVYGHGSDGQLAWVFILHATTDAALAPLTPSVPQEGCGADAGSEALLLARDDAELRDVRGKRVVGLRMAKQLHCCHFRRRLHSNNCYTFFCLK